MNQQFAEKALHQFQEAYQAQSTDVIPLVNEGIAYLYLRKLTEAEETLKKAVALDPKSLRGWYSLGVAQMSDGSQEAALADFQHALALDPNDPDTHYFIGSQYLGLKKYDEAVAEFTTTLKIAPLHASAQFGLAKALQREGKVDESRAHLQRFQEITQAKIGTLMSSTYGEQGRYATVQDMLALSASPGEMIPVTFVRTSGVTSASLNSSVAKDVDGGGVCIIDLEGNGSKDLIVMTGGQGLRAYHVAASGVLELIPNEKTGLLLTGNGVSCAVGDYDNDGLADLAVALADHVVLFHNLGAGKFADVTAAVGIHAINHPAGISFVDYDHDGDLDLFVTGSADAGTPSVLWRNNGNSTFTEWTTQTGLGGSGATRGAVLSDVNNDRAVDLIVSQAQGAPQVYLNQREGAFLQRALYSDANLPPARALAIADFNKDGWMDVAVTHQGTPGVTLWRNMEGQRYERIPLDLPGVTSAWGITPVDFDNDGWIDLAVIVETAKGTELRVLRNGGANGFIDVSDKLGLLGLDLAGARSVITADVDNDGAADLLISRLDAAPVVLHNQGGTRNHSLRIDLAGLADNKSAIGTKVEIFAGADWQKFEVTGASGYQSQGSTEILAGLGQSDRADVVRLLWPTGVPQDELDMASNKPVALKELDRRGSSCPVLFAWDGSKYVFISDVIGAAVVGHWVSPTERNKSDTDEWTKIDGDKLRARNGLLSVRFGEPMEEINYIDQLRMVAVDHPAGTEVYPDERFMNEPPFASGRTMVASSQTRLPAGAWDDHGHDVLATLSAIDHNYVQDFNNLQYAGFANQHTLTLDLGDWSAKNPLRLFMHGYIEYFSASSMYSAWQAGIQPQSPSVEAQLPDGTWKLVVDDMGFPAGLPRTIVVDLTGKLPSGTRRIRMKTNLQIYWDQVLIDNGPDSSAKVRQTELPLASAHLAFRGYPKQIEGATPGDLTYDYQSISATGPFQWQRGAYTKYGNVTPLLVSKDNHHVIFGSGEDIDAEFNEAALPKLPAGWKRDYFFYADGFVKDMDFYEALPFTVAEMPFHGMSSYPYPSREHFPDDPASVAYRLDWNDRVESGERTQRFQFDYEPVLSQPIVDQK
jgi:Tfp pilus assembly protein PilF